MPIYNVSASDNGITADTLVPTLGLGISDNGVVHSVLQKAYIAGASAVAAAIAHDSASGIAKFHVTAMDRALLTGVLTRAYLGLLNSGGVVGNTIHVARAITIAEHSLVSSSFTAAARYRLAIAEACVANGLLQWFYGGTLHEHAVVAHTMIPTWQFAGVASDLGHAHEVIGPQLVFRIPISDTADVEDDALVKMIFDGTLADSACVQVAYIDPGGGFTTWAINTRTSAVTEYDNYEFNSFCQMGHHFLGASSSGLYVLDGPLDNGAAIPTQIKSGLGQLNGSRFTSISEAYLGLRVNEPTGHDWLLKIRDGTGNCWTYSFRPRNMETTKVELGKGLRMRYIGWELITPGEDYDMDSVEFVPIMAKRRV